MGKKTVTYGVVGLKRGAELAAEGLGVTNAKLVAACDCNPDTLASAKKTLEEKGLFGCTYFLDFEEFLKSDFDAVIIATDAIHHVPLVLRALDAGKHVLCEIPSVNSVEEAKILKQTVKDHPNLIYMAGENCCYWAFIETWKQMREQGDFGEMVYAEAEYLHAVDPDKFSAENYPKNHWRTTQPAIHYLTHELGPLLYILEDDCISVSCMEPDIHYNPHTPHKKECGVALMKTKKGAVIRILISFGTYTYYDHNYRLCGTRGTIETDRNTMVDEAHSFANLYRVPGTFREKLEIPVTTRHEDARFGGHGGSDRKMLEDFFRCIREGKSPKLDVDFAIRMSLPGIIAHQSAEQGGKLLEIPEI
ncbi:MAG: Gfo/Idh/MocA family oxidoreductase [Clostridia bacterium]|nr:Gfo/Idh/MocA family oxidoreductase [Clostridia bacterium]